MEPLKRLRQHPAPDLVQATTNCLEPNANCSRQKCDSQKLRNHRGSRNRHQSSRCSAEIARQVKSALRVIFKRRNRDVHSFRGPDRRGGLRRAGIFSVLVTSRRRVARVAFGVHNGRPNVETSCSLTTAGITNVRPICGPLDRDGSRAPQGRLSKPRASPRPHRARSAAPVHFDSRLQQIRGRGGPGLARLEKLDACWGKSPASSRAQSAARKHRPSSAPPSSLTSPGHFRRVRGRGPW